MAEARHFASYEEFYRFYLTQHSDRRNRIMHAVGTFVGIAIVGASFATHHPWRALIAFPVGYGFAWFGHFALEGNVPATFGHPVWSFASDYRMLWGMLTGKVR